MTEMTTYMGFRSINNFRGLFNGENHSLDNLYINYKDYTEEGKKQIRENIQSYLENAKIIKEGLEEAGFTTYGGVNSPYIWLQVPQGMTSWEFFDKLLEEVNIVGTPGSGFGPHGEGYFSLTAFGTRENTIKAMERIKNLKNIQNY